VKFSIPIPKHAYEGIVWNRIALKYLARHVNEAGCTIDRQAIALYLRDRYGIHRASRSAGRILTQTAN
jgi:hypothetical protein